MQPRVLSHFSFVLLLVVFGVLLIIGAVCWWLRRRKENDAFINKFYYQMMALTLTSGVFGFAFLAFRQWQVYLFGARFWFLLWFIVFGIWFGYILYYLIKIIPARREARDAEELFGKYLPKKKK